METREILLKADRIVVALERLEDGKTRATTTIWDDAKVISPNQVLAVGHRRQVSRAGPGGQADPRPARWPSPRLLFCYGVRDRKSA
jgi:hypothetical protein